MTTELNSTLTEKYRLTSIDLMRGIVMIIMALDHSREFFHIDAQTGDPSNLATTTPFLFFTRWITHFCAPAFVFLSGLSAGISRARKSNKELSWFLFTRGVWLIILEITVIRFGFVFNLYYDVTFFEVIWVIGASMVVLSVLVYLPQQVVLWTGIVLIFVHDGFNFFDIEVGEPGYALWRLLQRPGFIPLGENSGIGVSYPLLPWLGIMLAGYGFARLYTHYESPTRKKILLSAGITTVALFVLIRFLNVHVPLDGWAVQKNALFTVMSFVNCVKYPVTLVFTLMTLGPVLIVLAFTEQVKGWLVDKTIVFGRVPLFYFVVHFYLIHLAALITYMIVYSKSLSEVDFHLVTGLGGIPRGVGYTLIWTYVVWIGTILVTYPLCKWYNDYKSRHKHWWLSYL